MVKRIAALLFLGCLLGYGAQTTVNLELFSSTLTAGSPGTNFNSVVGTFFSRAVGPRIASIASPGSSADHRGAIAYGLLNFTNTPAATNGQIGCWIFVKKLPPVNPHFIFKITTDFGGTTATRFAVLADGRLRGELLANTVYYGPLSLNKWYWVGFVWVYPNGKSNPHDYRALVKPIDGAIVEMGTDTTTYGAYPYLVQFGDTVANGMQGRMGGCSLSTVSTLPGDYGPPTELIDPTTTAVTWYLNPNTGNDSNTGLSSTDAWLTATNVASESLYCGIMSASSYTNGNVLSIDTSAGDLPIGGAALTFTTGGLNIQAAPGQTWWRAKLHGDLANGSFTATTGTAKTYQQTIGPGQDSTVVWEDDKWLNHPAGATWILVSNSVDTVAGSFWTDGTTVYVHPFGDTNPTLDGKSYTRSIKATTTHILISAPDIHLRDLYTGKTALADKSTQDPIETTFATGAGHGGTSLVEHCYFYYGGKHMVGLAATANNSYMTIRDVQAEQGSPWATLGGLGQNPFVSYMAGGTNNIHRYENCSTLKDTGLIGSTVGTNQNPAFYSHGTEAAVPPFTNIFLVNCNFPRSSSVFDSVVYSKIFVQRGTYHTLAFKTNSFINEATVGSVQHTYPILMVMSNCVVTPFDLIGGATWGIQGTSIVQNTTFDLLQLTGSVSGITIQGLIQKRTNSVLTFVNNVFKTQPGTLYSVFGGIWATNDIVSSNNVYVLGSSNYVIYAYNDGVVTTNRTLAQWQAFGYDANTLSQDPCLDSKYRPYAKTPTWNIGVEHGPMNDYTGKLYQSRRTCGAYEYKSDPMLLISR